MSTRTHCEKMNLYSTDTSIATGSLSSHNEPPLIFKYVYFENMLKRMEENGHTLDLKSLIFFRLKQTFLDNTLNMFTIPFISVTITMITMN